MFAPILALSCLLLSSCSSTARLAVAERPAPAPRVPAALTEPCPAPRRGPLKTTGAIVDRLVWTEGALRACAAQVDGVRAWDAAVAAADAGAGR